MKAVYNQLKDYLNKKPIGTLILRKDLNNYVSNSYSIDIYRRRLTILGYLSHVGRGLYKKEKDIPDSLSSSGTMRAYKNVKVKL